MIVWSEGDNDLALSFQEKEGCDEIWEKICQVCISVCLLCFKHLIIGIGLRLRMNKEERDLTWELATFLNSIYLI